MKYLILLGIIVFSQNSYSEDEFYLLERDNKKMEEAMKMAKSTLEYFLKISNERPDRYDAYGAYIKVTDNGQTEYLWLVDVKPYDQKYLMGVLISKPRLVKNYKYGETIGFLPADIYDWQLRNKKTGVISGAYTICAMLNTNSHDDMAYFKENNFGCRS